MRYAVQYVRLGMFGQSKIVEDTKPISREEAMALYSKHREDFVNVFRRGDEAQLVVWEDVGEGEFPISGTELIDLDTRDDLEYANGVFYKKVRTKIVEPEL